MPAGETSNHPPIQADDSEEADHPPKDLAVPSAEPEKSAFERPESPAAEYLTDESTAMRLPDRRDQPSGSRMEADSTIAPKRENRGHAKLGWALLPLLACVAVLGYLVNSYFHKLPDSATKAFWLPASVASKPVLLCLPRPMVYRPSDKLFERYRTSHPDAFATREARQDQILLLDPRETIQWGDMVPSRNAGPGIGGVIAAINISKSLTEQGIRFELRFGKEATYAEMRDSPVVIVGAINTEWATQVVAESSFAFDETPGSPAILEVAGAKRIWRQETSNGHVTRDYGMITRQLSGKAGQFLVQVAGISHFGTAAASEILVQPQELERVLRSESSGLQKKNVQIVVSTDVTDERAGPPHVVAVSTW
jgi:hypothetical protein